MRQVSIGGRAMTMRRGLTAILVAQGLIAVLLVASDLDARWFTQRVTDDTLQTGPVSPGDQVRRYDPSRKTPSYTDPAVLPELDLPAERQKRLQFTRRDLGEAGPVLLLDGPILSGDAKRLEAFLASFGDISMPVALNSPGGVVDEALAIGRMLREHGADTVILPGLVCVSSCPYVLAGGVDRRVSGRGAVGMHQHYYRAPAYLPAYWAVEEVQHGQGQVMDFLIEMGVDPGLMRYSLNTPPDEIYVLVAQELLDSRLATEILE